MSVRHALPVVAAEAPTLRTATDTRIGRKES
jgi:hypothetical protein